MTLSSSSLSSDEFMRFLSHLTKYSIVEMFLESVHDCGLMTFNLGALL